MQATHSKIERQENRDRTTMDQQRHYEQYVNMNEYK